MSSLKQTVNHIQSLNIQGASNIARQAVKAWDLHLRRVAVGDAKNFLTQARNAAEVLSRARPNEPLTVNVFKILNARLKQATKMQQLKSDPLLIKKFARQYADDLSIMLHANGVKIAGYGAELIKDQENIFTHCHSRSVENIFIQAKKNGCYFHVYNDETRPLFQGRLTSAKLAKAGIENTMVVDGAAAFIVSDHSGDDIKINKVFLGCDVIFPDGSALNKIGSFGIALAAPESRIPLYLAGSLLKFTDKQKMKIELRRQSEIWPGQPKNLQIINYAFDKIPARFITGYITELGLIKPKNVGKAAEKLFHNFSPISSADPVVSA